MPTTSSAAARDVGARNGISVDGTVEQARAELLRANMVERARSKAVYPIRSSSPSTAAACVPCCPQHSADLLHVLDAARAEREALVRHERNRILDKVRPRRTIASSARHLRRARSLGAAVQREEQRPERPPLLRGNCAADLHIKISVSTSVIISHICFDLAPINVGRNRGPEGMASCLVRPVVPMNLRLRNCLSCSSSAEGR